MNLLLRRQKSGPKATIGDLHINFVRECYTLEDVVRPNGEKVYGQTAIPAGSYSVVLAPSPKFGGKLMPHVLNVPNFEGILIHAGNSDVDTEGCILVGQTKVNDDFIGSSRAAFDILYPKLVAASGKGEKIVITIEQV